jgi:hypothetical protein
VLQEQEVQEALPLHEEQEVPQGVLCKEARHVEQAKEEKVHPPLPLDQALLPHKERQEVHQAEAVLLPSQEEEMSQEVHQM